MTKERKQEIIATYRRDEKDTGFSRSSNSSFTERINNLTEHLKTHQKDITQEEDYYKWLELEEVY